MSLSFFEALCKYRHACDECEPFRFQEYVNFVESLTPEEYPQAFPLHIMHMCQTLCDGRVMHGARDLQPQPLGPRAPDYSRQVALAKVLLEYHDTSGEARAMLRSLGKHPLDFIAHTCVWLFHAVAQRARDVDRPPQAKLDPALARYIRFLLEDFQPSEGVLEFLQNSLPFNVLYHPAAEPAAEPASAPQPEIKGLAAPTAKPANAGAGADFMRGYPPCVQRVYRKMLSGDLTTWIESSFFWRLFPGAAEIEALLRDIPSASRREDERHVITVDRERCQSHGQKRFAPGCKYLQMRGVCSVRDIEDLPVGAAFKQMNREARERFHGRLRAGETQSACAILCGAKSDATDTSGFSPFRAITLAKSLARTRKVPINRPC